MGVASLDCMGMAKSFTPSIMTEVEWLGKSSPAKMKIQPSIMTEVEWLLIEKIKRKKRRSTHVSTSVTTYLRAEVTSWKCCRKQLLS